MFCVFTKIINVFLSISRSTSSSSRLFQFVKYKLTSNVKWSGCERGNRKSEKDVSCLDDTSVAFCQCGKARCFRVRQYCRTPTDQRRGPTSYARYRKVPPMSSSCSNTTGSKGYSSDAFSNKVLQQTRPLGPAPMIATFMLNLDGSDLLLASFFLDL